MTGLHFKLLLWHTLPFQAKMTLAAECTEKELKILKDEVRALHVSTLDIFFTEGKPILLTRKQANKQTNEGKLNRGSIHVT